MIGKTRAFKGVLLLTLITNPLMGDIARKDAKWIFNTNHSLGGLCADLKNLLDSGNLQACKQHFHRLMEEVRNQRSRVSYKDLYTIASLTKQYAALLVKEGESNTAIAVVRECLRLSLPAPIYAFLMAYLQTLNPDKLSLLKLIERCSAVSPEDKDGLSWKDSLFIDVCKIALVGDYTTKRFEVEKSFFSESYEESERLARDLLQSVKEGNIYVLEELISVETCYLKKIITLSQFLLAKRQQESLDSLSLKLSACCASDKAFADAMEDLLLKISSGKITRSWEVDQMLFFNALNKSSTDPLTAIKLLEVLTDRGQNLTSSIASNGYFKLLELYLKRGEKAKLGELLKRGVNFFKEDSSYFSEYVFFQGAYAYCCGEYRKAIEVLSPYQHDLRVQGRSLAEGCILAGCSYLKLSRVLQEALQRRSYYSFAEALFYKAYKNYGSTQGGVGWFLCKALLRDKDSCMKFIREELATFSKQEQAQVLSVYSYFFSPIDYVYTTTFPLKREKDLSSLIKDGSRGKAVNVHDLLEESLAFLASEARLEEDSNGIVDFLSLTSREKIFSAYSEVPEMVEEILVQENNDAIVSLIKNKKMSPEEQQAWEVLLAIRSQKSLEKEKASGIFFHLQTLMKGELPITERDSYQNFFHKFLNSPQETALGKAYVLFILSRCDLDLSLDVISTVIPQLPYGDRLFILWSYKLNPALLKHFPSIFPLSAFLPIADYVLAQNLEQDEYLLQRAHSNLEGLPYFIDREVLLISLKSQISLALSRAYLKNPSSENTRKAIEILEELKEVFLSPAHPLISLWKKSSPKAFYSQENQMNILLAQLYSLREEKDLLKKHLIESLERYLITDHRFGKYEDGSLKASMELNKELILQQNQEDIATLNLG